MEQGLRVILRGAATNRKAGKWVVGGERAITGTILRVRKSRGGTEYQVKTRCRHG